LAGALARRGDEVIVLTRRIPKDGTDGSGYAKWNPAKGELDLELRNNDVIVNLAGANLAAKRWTKAFKEEIVRSRVDSTKLLVERINESDLETLQFIQMSGVNYYGADSHRIHNETDPAGTDFIGEVCRQWEAEARKLKRNRLAVLRMAPVLAREEGALPRMVTPAKFGLAAALGSGKQPFPWIHLYDVTSLIVWLIDNPVKSNTYNVAAPDSVSNKEFMQELARALHRPFFMPNVPGFVLRILFGEMADLLTGRCEVSILRLIEAGYKFTYPHLGETIKSLLKK
jgi:uncharacterized protein